MAHKTPDFDLTTQCTACGYKIPPAEVVRPGFDLVLCPKCGVTFEPATSKLDSQARGTPGIFMERAVPGSREIGRLLPGWRVIRDRGSRLP